MKSNIKQSELEKKAHWSLAAWIKAAAQSGREPNLVTAQEVQYAMREVEKRIEAIRQFNEDNR